MEWVKEDWNKSHFLEQQIAASIKKTHNKIPVRLINVTDTNSLGPISYNYELDIDILELRINEPVELQQNRSLSRDVNTNNYSDEAEDLRKSHTTVYADFTQYEKSINALFRVAISTNHLPDMNSTLNEVVAESFTWESKYATYSGNFLALGTKEAQLSKTKPKPVPSTEQIFKDLCRQIFNKSSKKIADSFQ